jgi:hypothetical protein
MVLTPFHLHWGGGGRVFAPLFFLSPKVQKVLKSKIFEKISYSTEITSALKLSLGVLYKKAV